MPLGGQLVARRTAPAASADQDRSNGTQAGTPKAVFRVTFCPGQRVRTRRASS